MTFQSELNAVIRREVDRRIDCNQQTIDRQAAVLFELRLQLVGISSERDELQRLLDIEHTERRKHQSRADKLAQTMRNPSPAAPDSTNDLRVVQDQLQHLSSRLVAIQSDSANYHHLLNLIGAKSMVQAITWVQFHQQAAATATETQPACGSVIIGSAYDKDCNPRD